MSAIDFSPTPPAPSPSDTQMLDWLIAHECHVRQLNGFYTLHRGVFADPREAIRKAMGEQL